MAKNPHRWRFHRIGGLELGPRTLGLLDRDHDGRVRAPDVVAAVEGCRARLKDLAALIPGRPELPYSALDDARREGRALLGAARPILGARGRAFADAVGPEDVADVSQVFDGTLVSGDGVVTPASAGVDAALVAARWYHCRPFAALSR